MPEKGSLPSFPRPFMKQWDDCDRPACDDVSKALAASMKRLGSQGGKPSGDVLECPPSSPQLGNSSWTLLHSMAAWYPDSPSKEEKTLVINFFAALARFYPCTWCATDFSKNLEEKPVRAETREDLCIWLCEQHNLVNQKIGKPTFKCDMKALDERWRKSSNANCQPNH